MKKIIIIFLIFLSPLLTSCMDDEEGDDKNSPPVTPIPPDLLLPPSAETLTHKGEGNCIHGNSYGPFVVCSYSFKKITSINICKIEVKLVSTGMKISRQRVVQATTLESHPPKNIGLVDGLYLVILQCDGYQDVTSTINVITMMTPVVPVATLNGYSAGTTFTIGILDVYSFASQNTDMLQCEAKNESVMLNGIADNSEKSLLFSGAYIKRNTQKSRVISKEYNSIYKISLSCLSEQGLLFNGTWIVKTTISQIVTPAAPLISLSLSDASGISYMLEATGVYGYTDYQCTRDGGNTVIDFSLDPEREKGLFKVQGVISVGEIACRVAPTSSHPPSRWNSYNAKLDPGVVTLRINSSNSSYDAISEYYWIQFVDKNRLIPENTKIEILSYEFHVKQTTECGFAYVFFNGRPSSPSGEALANDHNCGFANHSLPKNYWIFTWNSSNGIWVIINKIKGNPVSVAQGFHFTIQYQYHGDKTMNYIGKVLI